MPNSLDGYNDLQNALSTAGQYIVGPSYLNPDLFFGKPLGLNLRIDFALVRMCHTFPLASYVLIGTFS